MKLWKPCVNSSLNCFGEQGCGLHLTHSKSLISSRHVSVLCLLRASCCDMLGYRGGTPVNAEDYGS